jgi:hypothetical protein
MARHYCEAAEPNTTLEARVDNSALTAGALRTPRTVRAKDPRDVATPPQRAALGSFSKMERSLRDLGGVHNINLQARCTHG